MELDTESCFRAMASRDRRFEGRFFVGVITTGIYCRPGCPAPIPRRENVRFFGCAGAAEAAGYRACLRCRPAAVPHSPAGQGTSVTVSRALRLIGQGGLDEAGVGALAERLGVSDRHLRRLFDQHVGVGPLALARTRRAHFARRLIGETTLPLAEVALCAGFASVRRFNRVMEETFGCKPSELRAREPKTAGAAAAGRRLRLRLPFRPPYDWAAMECFLAARAVPGLEAVTAGEYRRTIHASGGAGVIMVRPLGAGALELELDIAPTPDLISIVERVSRAFDLGADPRAIAAHLGADARLAPLVRARPGLRVPGAWDGFELAVRAVLGQQVSLAAANRLALRLVQTWGQPLPNAVDGLTHLFPLPVALAEADLRRVGLQRTRAETLREIAAAVAGGSLRFDSGPAEVVARLRAIAGVGEWTAEYVAMRALGEPDAFPAADLVLRRVFGRGVPVTAANLTAHSQAWRPWRAYAALHLWTEEAS